MPDQPFTLCAETGDAGRVFTSLSLWSFSVVLIVLALVSIALIVRNLGLARRARAARHPEAALRKGPAVLEGQVDHPGDAPLRVAIAQTGIQIQYGDSPGPVEWTEAGRTLTAKPFKLRLASNRLVDVIPDDRVALLLEMNQTIQESDRARTRIAEVNDGDRIFVSGRIELRQEADPAGGYRGGTIEKALLRPASGGGMLVSKRPLDRVFLAPIRQYVVALTIVAAVFGGVHSLYFGYHARVRAGAVVPGQIVDKRVVVDSDEVEHEELEVAVPDGPRVVVNPTVACFRRIEEGDRIPVLLARFGGNFWQVGRQPSVNLAVPMVAFVLVAGGFIAYALVLRASRKWYAGRLLDES